MVGFTAPFKRAKSPLAAFIGLGSFSWKKGKEPGYFPGDDE